MPRVGLIVACAITVVVVDVLVQTSLLRIVRPVITHPADGAITEVPVIIRWEGLEPLSVTLTGSGLRQELGPRHSPFELGQRLFPRPGQYRVTLRSPSFGRLIRTDRLFLVTLPEADEASAERTAPDDEKPKNDAALLVARLREERDRLATEKSSLNEDNRALTLDNRDFAADLDHLQQESDQTAQRLAQVEAQQAELLEEHLLVVQENQLLRMRLDSLPACTTWGYLSYPRPQNIPQTRRIVLVSNGRGDVFRSQAECFVTRRNDPTAGSPCVCVGPVGPVWDGRALP
jgi:hypothetical protein